MAFTQSDIYALNGAIASGELRVVIDGKEVTYRSVAELLQAKRHIQKEIATAQGRRRGLDAFALRVDRGIR